MKRPRGHGAIEIPLNDNINCDNHDTCIFFFFLLSTEIIEIYDKEAPNGIIKEKRGMPYQIRD